MMGAGPGPHQPMRRDPRLGWGGKAGFGVLQNELGKFRLTTTNSHKLHTNFRTIELFEIPPNATQTSKHQKKALIVRSKEVEYLETLRQTKEQKKIVCSLHKEGGIMITCEKHLNYKTWSQ